MEQQFLDPKNVVTVCDLSPDAHVADFGAGSGVYTFLLAEGFPMRRIFAIDVQKDLVDHLQKEALKRGVQNVHAIWGDVDEVKGSMLRNESIDCVLMANILFQLEDISTALKEAHRILKQGGKLLVIDWTDSFGHLGPHPDHVVTEERAKRLLEETGFLIEKKIEDAGAHHYAFLAEKV